MTKHTPGPWRLDGGVVRGFSTPDHERPICEIFRKPMPDDETIANAALITAAPDLFKALQQAEAFISIALPHYAKDRNEAVEILPGIRTALAKASGEVFSTDENCTGMHNG